MIASMRTPPAGLVRALAAGLAAGAVAAVPAVLLNLPLKSPDDAFFNSASVAIGALVAGLVGGALWWAVRSRLMPLRDFLIGIGVAFVLVAVGALVLERMPGAPLSGLVRFVVPLAAVIWAVVALLTPLLVRWLWHPQLVAPAGALAALLLGIALAGRGDAESGRLALPALLPPASVAGQPGAGGQTGNAGLINPQDVAGVAYAVDPAQSAVTYTVHEKLSELPLPSDAVGRTSQLNGTLFLDGRPSTVAVNVSTFRSDQPMRDRFIRDDRNGPQLGRFPEATFTAAALDLPAEYREGETVTHSVAGDMTIRGVTKPLTFAVEARLQGGVLAVHATTDFTWADFQIPPPNLRGFVQVEDNVHIEVLLVATGSRD